MFCLSDNIAERGERLELLVKKTDDLSQNVRVNSLLMIVTVFYFNMHLCHKIYFLLQSVTFRKTSRNLARVMFWKNVKLYVIVGGVAVVSSSYDCGSVKWFILSEFWIYVTPMYYLFLFPGYHLFHCVLVLRRPYLEELCVNLCYFCLFNYVKDHSVKIQLKSSCRL